MPRYGVKRGGKDLLFLRCHGEDQSGMMTERKRRCCVCLLFRMEDESARSDLGLRRRECDDDESLAAAWGRMEPTAGKVLRVAAVK